MEHNAHTVLDAAFAGGVRYFDAARSYGKAEAFLATWLERRGVSAEDVTVGSKWGYTYTAGWRVDADPAEVKDLSAATLRRQLGESRALLGEHLRLYQIHSATLESGVLDDREVLGELERLREEGMAIGVSVTGPEQPETIRRALQVGIFDTVQATWNLLERSAGPALAEAHAAGLGVIVKEVLANGRLTARAGESLLVQLAAERKHDPGCARLRRRSCAALGRCHSLRRDDGRAAPEQPHRARRGVGRGDRPATRTARRGTGPVLVGPRGAAVELTL